VLAASSRRADRLAAVEVRLDDAEMSLAKAANLILSLSLQQSLAALRARVERGPAVACANCGAGIAMACNEYEGLSAGALWVPQRSTARSSLTMSRGCTSAGAGARGCDRP
jgi:hypothetical protein